MNREVKEKISVVSEIRWNKQIIETGKMEKEDQECGRIQEEEPQRASTPKDNRQGIMAKIFSTPKETLRKIRENITSPKTPEEEIERGEDEMTQIDEEENEEIRATRTEIRGQREEMNKTYESLKEVEIRAQQIQKEVREVEDNWYDEVRQCGGMCRERERDHMEALEQGERDKKKIEDLEEELNNYEYQLQEKDFAIQEYRITVENNQKTLNKVIEEKRKIEEEKGEMLRRIKMKEEHIKEME